MFKKIFKNNKAVSNILEFSVSAGTIVIAISLVTIALSLTAVDTNPLVNHEILDKYAYELMSVSLSSEADAGLMMSTTDDVLASNDYEIVTSTVEGPDLTVSITSCSPTTVYPGDTITVEFTVENLNTCNCYGFEYTITLGGNSVTESVDLTDNPLSSATDGITLTDSITAPSSAGTYTLTVHVDPYEGDIDYTNNDDSTSITVKTVPVNHPPNKPSKPQGETNCDSGVMYTYTTSTTDPDGDKVYYYFNYPDFRGRYRWYGPYDSGETCSVPFTFMNMGTYDVIVDLKVKAKDEHDAESDWSESLRITVHGGIGPGPEPIGWETTNCFLSGTKIMMEDGTLKNIEDIKINDKLVAYDPETGTFQTDTVIETYHDKPYQMPSDYYLTINKNIKITPGHLLYINNKWIKAEDLKIGDRFLKGKVISIEKNYKKVDTFNLELEKYHTYLVVGDKEIIIAHNGKYIISGYEETIQTEKKSGTIDNTPAILDMEKIVNLQEKTYLEVKELMGKLPDYINFQLTIYNKDSTFCFIQPDDVSPDNAKDVAIRKEPVLIYYQPEPGTTLFIQAFIQITVF